MARIDPDYRYTYTVTGEAWYTDRLPNAYEARKEMMIQRHAVNKSGYSDGVAWEFEVAQYELSGPTLQIRLFHDAWDAFEDIPELFEAFRKSSPRTLDQLRGMLDELGFIDTTERRRGAEVRMDLFSQSLPHVAVVPHADEASASDALP